MSSRQFTSFPLLLIFEYLDLPHYRFLERLLPFFISMKAVSLVSPLWFPLSVPVNLSSALLSVLFLDWKWIGPSTAMALIILPAIFPYR